MAETKHTAGPWAKSKTAYGWDIRSGDTWVGTAHDDHCDRVGPRPGFPGNIEGEANADLMVAAPTLQAKIDHLEAENKQVKGLIADNLKQIGELKHYLHERGGVIVSLEAEKAELVEICQASLKAFRAIYDKLESGKSFEGYCPFCEDLLEGEHYWPLSKLRTVLSKHTPVSEQGAEKNNPKPEA